LERGIAYWHFLIEGAMHSSKIEKRRTRKSLDTSCGILRASAAHSSEFFRALARVSGTGALSRTAQIIDQRIAQNNFQNHTY
jgi:hypothetical protein